MPRAAKKSRTLDIPGSAFGEIPGIRIGSWWATRKDCSADHVHPPWIAGIYGRKDDGARSVVLSGESEFADDDYGDKFTYIGSGGREPGVRFGPQTMDQTWSNNLNAAMKRSYLLKKKVRVIRGAGEHGSKYSPYHGFRYDGLYYVTKAVQEQGPNGFLVCKFELERCPDQDPLPEDRGPKDKSDVAVRRREWQRLKYPNGIPKPAKSRTKKSGVRGSQTPLSEDEEGADEDEDVEALFTGLDEIVETLQPVEKQLVMLGEDSTTQDARKELLVIVGRRVRHVIQMKKEQGSDVKYWRESLWDYVATRLPRSKRPGKEDELMTANRLMKLFEKLEKKIESRASEAAQSMREAQEQKIKAEPL